MLKYLHQSKEIHTQQHHPLNHLTENSSGQKEEVMLIDDDDDDVQGLGISVHVSSDYMKLVHFSRDVSFVRLIAKCSTACTTSLPASQLSHKTLPTRRGQNRQLSTPIKITSKPLPPNPIFDIRSFQALGSTTATSAMQIHPL